MIGRYIVVKILAKRLTFKKGFAAGLGHGGIEAIILIGSSYINNLIYSIMINTGTFDVVVQSSDQIQPGLGMQLEAVRTALIQTNWSIFLLAGYERILTMIAHIVLNFIVLYFLW